MSGDDVDNMIKDLDLNGDGKISLSEFAHWWLTGRRGLTGTMRRLVSAKLKATKFIDTCSQQAAAMIAKAQMSDNHKESHFRVVFQGDTEKSGFHMLARVMPFSNEAK